MNSHMLLMAVGWTSALLFVLGSFYLYWKKTVALVHQAKELTESRAMLHVAMESSVIGAAIVAPDGRWLKVNNAICNMFGYSKEEMLKTDFQSLTYPQDLPRGLDTMRRMLNREADYAEIEKRYIRKDGSIFWAIVYAKPHWNEDGSLKYLVDQIIDITARIEAQDAREKLITELMQVNAELERFAFIASHDLQEPLRTICSFADLIGQEYGSALGDEGTSYISIILSSGNRLRDLVRDLLDYAKAGRHDEMLTSIDVQEALDSAIEHLMQRIKAAGAEISSEPLPRIQGNFTQFVTLLQNLISNSIKYQAKDNRPVIRILSAECEEFWTFTVADNGIGLRPEYAAHIFEPFKRLHGSDEYQGTGMGLAICRKIVEGMGGMIWAEPLPSGGSAFHFTIRK